MHEHSRVRLARLFGLALAYDRRRIECVQFLAPGTLPMLPGPWTICRL